MNSTLTRNPIFPNFIIEKIKGETESTLVAITNVRMKHKDNEWYISSIRKNCIVKNIDLENDETIVPTLINELIKESYIYITCGKVDFKLEEALCKQHGVSEGSIKIFHKDEYQGSEQERIAEISMTFKS